MRTNVAWLLLVLGTACATTRPPISRPTSPAPAPLTARGAVAMTVLADPNGAPPKLNEGERFVSPKILPGYALPAYPAEALAANARTAFVVVRITIDTNGRVAKVEDSPAFASSPSPFAGAFRSAVDTAVRTWRFKPGYIEQLEDGKDMDGDGKPDYTVQVGTTPVEVLYDVRFDFQIVHGEGKVRASIEDGR